MAFPNTSAGVYAEDNDQSQRGQPIISSIAAFVVESAKGNTKDWTEVFDKQDLKDKFGIKNFQKFGFGMHCAEQHLAFSRILVKRAVDAATARTAGAYLTVDDIQALDPVLKLTCFDDGTNQPKGVLGDPAETIGFVAGTPGVQNIQLAIYATSAGEWSDEISVRVRPSAPLGTAVGEHSDPKHFYIDVFLNYKGEASVPVESFLVSRKVELDGEGQQMFVEDRVNTRSNYIRVKNNALSPIIDIRKEVFEYFDGGEDGNRASTQQLVNAWEGIEDTDSYNAQILVNAGYVHPDIQRRMIAVAEARGDALAILDVPFDLQEVARAVNYRRNVLNVSNSFGTLYGPWCQVTDDVTGRRFWCPASGLVSAQYAYNDMVRGFYWAPAGITRGRLASVTDIFKKYGLQERNALEQAQINVIRKIPGRGFVIFDAQTLQAFASGYQWVNVRRLVNGIKAMVRKSFLPSVFNPNDSFERQKLKDSVDGEMDIIQRNRGVNEYESICDERNNTAAVIANNDMKFDLILDPSIPAKRAHLGADIRNVGQGASVTFSEGN